MCWRGSGVSTDLKKRKRKERCRNCGLLALFNTLKILLLVQAFEGAFAGAWKEPEREEGAGKRWR